MKKIPTLFKRIYENHKVIGITDEVTEGCEFVLDGKGTPTVKYDGSCCAIIGGQLYKRYDAKRGRNRQRVRYLAKMRQTKLQDIFRIG